MMKKLIKSFVFLFLIFVFLSTSVFAQNLIVNGDFESGNTGFTTDYRYSATGGSHDYYGVVTNAKTWFVNFEPCTDHTTGTGNMMVAVLLCRKTIF